MPTGCTSWLEGHNCTLASHQFKLVVGHWIWGHICTWCTQSRKSILHEGRLAGDTPACPHFTCFNTLSRMSQFERHFCTLTKFLFTAPTYIVGGQPAVTTSCSSYLDKASAVILLKNQNNNWNSTFLSSNQTLKAKSRFSIDCIQWPHTPRMTLLCCATFVSIWKYISVQKSSVAYVTYFGMSWNPMYSLWGLEVYSSKLVERTKLQALKSGTSEHIPSIYLLSKYCIRWMLEF